MSNWIETKLRYDKIMENGMVKKVNEHFLVDALSFTEAEARIIQEQSPYISGDFSVSAVKKTKIAEVFLCDTGDKFYLVKFALIQINERTGVEKKSIVQSLQQADDLYEAYQNFMENMKGTMADLKVISISETPILETYKANLDKSDEKVSD